MSEKEYGIRVFFKDGTFDDFDPVQKGDYVRDGENLSIWRGQYTFTQVIEDVVEYEIRNEKIDGIYVRVFADKKHIKYSSDIVEAA